MRRVVENCFAMIVLNMKNDFFTYKIKNTQFAIDSIP